MSPGSHRKGLLLKRTAAPENRKGRGATWSSTRFLSVPLRLYVRDLPWCVTGRWRSVHQRETVVSLTPLPGPAAGPDGETTKRTVRDGSLSRGGGRTSRSPDQGVQRGRRRSREPKLLDARRSRRDDRASSTNGTKGKTKSQGKSAREATPAGSPEEAGSRGRSGSQGRSSRADATARRPRGGRDTLVERIGGRSSPGPFGPISTGVVAGYHGGKLLWCEDQGCRNRSEGGNGEGRSLPLLHSYWDGQRKPPASSWREEGTSLPGSPLPCKLRPAGKWRSFPARPEGAARSSAGRGVGDVSRDRSRRSRGRRARAPEEKGSGARTPEERGGMRCQGTETQKESIVFSEVGGKGQEEKEEEGEEKKGGLYRRSACLESSAEGVGSPLRGDGAGPERAREETGHAPSPAFCNKEEREAEHLEQLKGKLQLLDVQPGRGSRERCGFLRGDQSEGAGRKIPGSVSDGNAPEYAAPAFDHLRGGGCRKHDEAGGAALLSERAEPSCLWPPSKGITQPCYGNRCLAQGAPSPDTRHNVSETQSPRSCSQRHGLGSGTEGGTRIKRGCSPDRTRGAPDGPEGVVSGCQGQVASPFHQSRQGNPEGKGEGEARQGHVDQGRQARGFKEGERKRRWEEVMIPGEASTFHQEGGEAQSSLEAPKIDSGALFPTFREGMRTSYAADEAFGRMEEPASTVKNFPYESSTGDPANFKGQGQPPPTRSQGTLDFSGSRVPGTKKDWGDLVGARVVDMGLRIQQWLLEVIPLRSSSTGKRMDNSVFPLPTSSSYLLELFPDLTPPEIAWLSCIGMGLNSLWGADVHFMGPVKGVAVKCLNLLVSDVKRISALEGTLEPFDWGQFFMTRGIDYKGDEVKTAREFCWQNIAPALPREIGRVPLSEVCTLGARHYVENLDLYIRPKERWVIQKAPRVMVSPADWPEVCSGLVSAGVCVFLRVSEVFHVGEKPLLNGLFGVTKDEWAGDHEVYRLIMNLTPFNGIAEPMKGDVETLPMWSLMSPYQIQPDESLLVSSEDVRCFFYTMSVPSAWYKFLAFNRRVPEVCLPPEMKGEEVYLASRVLPMGFANSVSLAQHVHRNLAMWSGSREDVDQCLIAAPEAEIRKDRPVTVANPAWRIYLDNYDLLEKVKSVDVGTLAGSRAPAVLALRHEYETWEVPRNLKKAVERSETAEVQGAQVDGRLGVAYPRESKLLKYLAAALSLMKSEKVTQRQVQVVCGGLVYVSMFRRQLLGCLNAVWRFIELFEQRHVHHMALPDTCRVEILRFIALVPLARLDFRLQYTGQVTCSDASTTGGGVCASTALSRAGSLAAQGCLRGQLPELRQEHQVVTIGLFDGIGALRVACDLLGLQVMGHISVEKDPAAQRVVTSHFPETQHYTDVAAITHDEVHSWACTFSQASLIIIGAGPPCQGVSGLNAQRKGALRDERSSLFHHVKRIWSLVKVQFPWCQVHCLMESVASMDAEDRAIMSVDFGGEPWACDAGQLTWCSRPRLYWISWDIAEQPGAYLQSGKPGAPSEVVLTACQDLEQVCEEGWLKVDPSRPFPTFTTSRPRARPGHKPAGVNSCSQADLDRWAEDSFRFPPYQYTAKNLLINKQDQMRLPTISEKEYMLGFPVGYTMACSPKRLRGSLEHKDLRHTLVGNTWSVPVVAWFLGQLCGPLGLCPCFTPQEIVDFLNPAHQTFLQSRLWRSTLRPLRGAGSTDQTILVQKLGNLTSVKGEDILLTTSSSQLARFHRLRASIPARLWRWRIISGWRWSGDPEHINALEMRAVLTTLKWRIHHKQQINCRFLHLVDSLVVLHALARGRSSSRKLRSTLSRINALLLCSGNQALWGYVQTDQNPADRPSRWGVRVRTKFRNA